MFKKNLWVLILFALPLQTLEGEVIGVSNVMDKIKVELEIKPFVAAEHRLKFYSDESEGGDSAPLLEIDGEKFYGTDGKVPEKEIHSFALKADGQCFEVPREGFKILFEPGVSNQVFPDVDGAYPSSMALRRENKKIVFFWSGGDGAGGYGVSWEFFLSQNKVKRSIGSVADEDGSQIDFYQLRACE